MAQTLPALPSSAIRDPVDGVPEPTGTRTQKVELPIDRLDRAGGAALERTLRTVRGVAAATVNSADGRARITYDASRVGISELVGAVRELGYEVGLASIA